jgi:hypothetical protein
MFSGSPVIPTPENPRSRLLLPENARTVLSSGHSTLSIATTQTPRTRDRFFTSITRQLADHFPDSDVTLAIHDALKKRPSLMDDISSDQARSLFIDAMTVASKLDLTKPVVVVIDGLNETDRSRLRDTAKILSTIFKAFYPNAKLFISSRPEDEIQGPFALAFDIK